MTKPIFSLPVSMDAKTTKRLLDDEVNRYGGLIWDGTIVAASDPTLAQQVRDDVAQSATDAQQSATVASDVKQSLKKELSALQAQNLDARLGDVAEDIKNGLAVADAKFLQAAKNFSDVPDPAAARIALGLDDPPEPIPSFFKDTLAQLQAVTGTPLHSVGYVLDDGANNGTYRYDGAAWVDQVSLPPAYTTQPVTTNVESTIYVSAGGDDAFNGQNLSAAVATIERAVELAEADPDTPVVIYVYPGTYQTQGHIDFPDHCAGVISATAARATKIVPAPGYEERNVFRMGNGGYVQGFSFEGGWRVNSLDDPTEGFAISFRPGAVINRTVYAHNIVMYRTGDPVLIPPPLDRNNQNPMVGHGGGVILADRDVVSSYSVFPQIMAWGATPSNPNGIGYCAKNGAFINAINAIAIWSHKQYMALNGGLIIASGCASQAGDWSLWSEGYRNQVEPYDANTAAISAYPTAASAIESNETAIQDAMWNHLVAEGYTDGLSTESAASLEAQTRKDATFLLLSLRYDLEAGQQGSVKLFTQGMFNWNAVPVWGLGDLVWFTMAWEKIRDEINALVSAGAQAMVTTLIDDVLVGTTNASTIPTKRIPSVVSAQNHQWNQTLGGVNGRAFSRVSQEVPQSIVEKNLGRVVYSGVDENGKQYFTGGALVNPLTGQLEGPPIDRTILPRARRAAIITGGQQ